MDFDFQIVWGNRALLLEGFYMTIAISALAVPVSIMVGVVIVLMRISKIFSLKSVAIVYIEIIRNTPFLIQIFLVFYALPFFGVRLSGIPTGILCLTIYGSAYFAEIFRGGIESVSRGQVDASKALGLPYMFYIRKVIFPQLLGYIIPPGTNIAITMVKESSLLLIISDAALTYTAH